MNMKNLDDEYINKKTIYEYQKKYRNTDLGKESIRRSNEKQTLKKMYEISNIIKCELCTESKFERLMIHGNKILCYSCRWERKPILSEIMNSCKGVK